MAHAHPRPEPYRPAERRQAALVLWLANIAIGVVVGANYLRHVPEDVGHPLVWLYAPAALVSSMLMLTLVPGLAFLAAAHWVRSTRLLAIAQGAFWTLFQVLVYSDTRIYNILKYHFNGQVWNLVYTRGSEDAIHLGWQVWFAVGIGFLVFGGAQAWVWRRALARARRRSQEAPRRLLSHPALVWLTVLVPTVFLEKTIYAQADLADDNRVTALAKLFPLYARVPMEDLASKVLGTPSERPPMVQLDGFELNYPLARPTLPADGPRPNVLVLVVDCLRSDVLEPATMPHLAAWADAPEIRRFEDHISGGNSTRYGIFSMLYGLHGSYWFSFLKERRSPVLVDALKEAGYEFGIFGSASMNYPELRATAWVEVEDSVSDEYGQLPAWQRDELAAADVLSWLEQREHDEDPFFGFFLIDAPHQTYSHPPDQAPFQPSAPEVDYYAVTRYEGPEPHVLQAVRNRYLNAVHHADRTLARVLTYLDASPHAEDTVVVVTGDHGEEFWECGFFGHTSAFTPPQLAVPLLLRGPGIAGGVETGPTSHMDFAPTVLELLGADPALRPRWTLGGNLFRPDPERRRVSSGWNELGVWTPGGILRMPLSVFEFDVEAYDYRWRRLIDDRQLLRDEHATLEQLGADCNRFLR